MNSYKTGDKVRCINPSLKGLEKDKTYKISWCYGAGLIVLEGVAGSWSESNFELLQEEDIDMKGKFKVGDKVVRTIGDFGFIREGDVCSVSGLRGDGQLEFDGDSARCYSPRYFELYVEEDMENILTPLQAAEAILNEDKLQVYDTDCNKWYTFSCGHRNITIEDLKHIKLRLKPKTIVINGVEVPAPLDTAALGYPDKIFGLNLSRKSVYDTTGHTNKGLFWATKEDAQKVLGVMLILFNEFNELNKGER